MFKPVSKVLICLCAAAVCMGWVYARNQVNDANNYEVRQFVEVVHSGDTFNGIVSQYYNHENEKECWDEWQTIQKQNNARLFANGRFLQPGDRIVITARVKVAK